MTDHIGQQIGNYQLIHLLREGGFAEVYLSEHLYLGSQAAIKLLQTRLAHNDIAQFQQEVRMLANLIHPNIVRVLDCGVDDHTPYLIVDYITGGTLRTRHPKGTRLPLPIVVQYVKQIGRALQYAHDQKLIHRDIKPENMLIGRDGNILLSDFGSALVAQSSRDQSTKDMADTIAYMAPEQIEAHPRPASDQYSLGIVAYEWLCGDRPFRGSFTEIAIGHNLTPPPSLLKQLPSLPSAVEQVILTALAKKSEDRFASIGSFVTALEQASTTEPAFPPTTPVPPPFLTQPLSRRSVVAGLTVLLAGGGIAWWTRTHVTPTNMDVTPIGTLLYIHTGQSSGANPVAWSPSGKRIASGDYDAPVRVAIVQVWNATDGSQPYTHTHISTYTGDPSDVIADVNAVAWSPDGKRIASGGGDGTVQVWNATDDSQPYTYTGHSSRTIDFMIGAVGVNAVAWSPDGKRIASGGGDGTVQVWNATDGSQPYTYTGHSSDVNAVAWSPNGKRIASGSDDGTVQVWNAADGSQPYTYTGHSSRTIAGMDGAVGVNAVAWSPDGKRIASGGGGGTVQVWNATDGSQPYTYTGHSSNVIDVMNGAVGVYAVAWSPDGKRIASGGNDGTVQVWNAADGSQPYTYTGHSSAVFAVAWSPDGKRIASANVDGNVQVWAS